MRKIFLLSIVLASLAGVSLAQKECAGLFAVPTFVLSDNAGVLHQTACWNGASPAMTFPLTPSGGGVTSVFTRTGAVSAAAADYSAVPNLDLGDGSSEILFNTVNGEITLTDATSDSLDLDGFGDAELTANGGSFIIEDTSGDRVASNGTGSVVIVANQQASITGNPIQLAGAVIVAGTQFTASGCSNSANVGGTNVGQFTSGTTGTCTVVLTFNGAGNVGWSCAASDHNTANLIRQTASNATTATLSGTTVSGDVISFLCLGY